MLTCVAPWGSMDVSGKYALGGFSVSVTVTAGGRGARWTTGSPCPRFLGQCKHFYEMRLVVSVSKCMSDKNGSGLKVEVLSGGGAAPLPAMRL